MIEIRNQNLNFFVLLNFDDFLFFVTKIEITKMDATKAITPPNLEGIDRKITYANKKYHSGWM